MALRQRTSWRLAAATALVLVLAWPAWSQAGDAAKAAAELQRMRVQKVVRKFVEQTGHSVTGCGSWISGAYNAVTSDHDMRLLLPENAANPGEAWRNAKRTLGNLIKEEFGDAAGPILERTNLYAPSQIMGTVLDAEDALSVYTKVGEVPNLGFAGKVDAKTPAKFVEGLYGEGSGAFTQFYEQTKGRCFYLTEEGKAVVGAVDLTHFLDGQRTFTSAGTANTALQWGEHCLDELRGGRSDKVLKYLKRLGNDLTKSRELARLATGTANKAEIAALVKALESGTPLSQVATRVRQLVTSSRIEASTLKSFATAGPIGRLMQRELLEGMESPQSPIGRLLRQIWEKSPSAAHFELAMESIMWLQAANTTAMAAATGDVGETLMVAGVQSLMLRSLPLGLVAELTKAIIDQARAGGIEMVANRQEAWDLMAGIYTGLGRERCDPDPQHTYTLERLVAECLNETELRRVVSAQSRRATDRGIAGAPATDDALTAEAMTALCYPVILQAWRAQRDLLVAEYLALAKDVFHTPVALSYTPCPVVWAGQPIDLKVTPNLGGAPYYQKISRMRRILVLLSGRGAGIDESWVWSPVSRSTISGSRSFRVSKPGTYTIGLTLTLKPAAGPNPVPDAEQLLAPGVMRAAVDIDVQDPTGGPVKATKDCWSLRKVVHEHRAPTGGMIRRAATQLGRAEVEIDGGAHPSLPTPFTVITAWAELPRTMLPGSKLTVT